MTNFSAKESDVRADIFKPSGKWYETVTISMEGKYEHSDLFEAVITSYEKPGIRQLGKDWMLVVLEPHHKHSHPVMIKGK
tara:strand:- start:341 stop:580 length:240 start_codon:yes stop_codon:yes gene_type:complete